MRAELYHSHSPPSARFYSFQCASKSFDPTPYSLLFEFCHCSVLKPLSQPSYGKSRTGITFLAAYMEFVRYCPNATGAYTDSV